MKTSVKKCPVPANTMLENYSTKGGYVDCYQTEVPGKVSFPEFIVAFYTTPLFKLERLILKMTVAKPSTDAHARELADGSRNEFAAWKVENRKDNEILMCDFRGHTRSWLMVKSMNIDSDPRTRLYFGSAVLPIQKSKSEAPSLGRGYQALLGFHKVYSVLLLYSSELQIQRRISMSPKLE